MHCVVKFNKIMVNGAFSLEAMNHWTSRDVFNAIKSGVAKIPSLSDGAPIYVDNTIVAKIIRALPDYTFTSQELIYEKNNQIPYFYGFEDEEDVFSSLTDEDDFLKDKKVVLAAKHIESDGYGTIFIIVKNESGSMFSLHVEDTMRGRNGVVKYGTYNFLEIDKLSMKNHVQAYYGFAREYQDILEDIYNNM